jgi:hypothetical protein
LQCISYRTRRVLIDPLVDTSVCLMRSTLVRLQFEGNSQQADAAFAALAALNSYNRTNKLATLHELVRRLIDGDSKVLLASACVKAPLLCVAWV